MSIEIKRFKCEKTEKKCWRELVKNENRVILDQKDGVCVKVECKDCKKVHDIYIYN